MRTSLTFIALLALATPAAFAQTNHGSGHGGETGHSAGHVNHGAMTEGVHAEATINRIDGDTVNVSHGPIAQIGWPAMTMDIKLLEGAEVGDVTAGDAAMMMLEKGSDGVYGIRALMPAK